VQPEDQRFRRYGKRETQYIKNKMFKEDTKEFYRNLGKKNIEARETPSMAEAQPYWQSMLGRKSRAQ
jgi:folate-dependent tRNA-U54 methylase TrmFO/GidA